MHNISIHSLNTDIVTYFSITVLPFCCEMLFKSMLIPNYCPKNKVKLCEIVACWKRVKNSTSNRCSVAASYCSYSAVSMVESTARLEIICLSNQESMDVMRYLVDLEAHGCYPIYLKTRHEPR